MNGIDVSQWQGDFDFTPYKNGFVIIRGGYAQTVDPWAERNIAKCNALGIPWGVYWYSYALSTEQGKREAERCLAFLNGRLPRLGVWIDMEDADHFKAQSGFPSNKTITDICRVFCETVQDAGNHTGIYASESWFGTKIQETGFDKWIASWGWNDGVHYPDLSGQCVMQQYRGSPLDLDVLYVPLNYFDGAEGPAQAQPEDVMVNATEMARQVIAGQWGNGDERRRRLTEAGHDYDAVQARVNELLAEDKIEGLARAVIRGEFGNGLDRMRALGELYDAVQTRVNKILGG